MFYMKKVILGVIVAVLIAGIIIARNAKQNASPLSNPDNKPVVKIGAQFALTGNMTDYSIIVRNALVKSIEDANNNPENKLHYELLIEDHQGDMRSANSIAYRFISVDKVNVLVDDLGSIARVTAPLAAKNKIPSFHHAYGSGFLNSKHNFKSLPTNDAVAEGIVRLLDSKGIKNVTMTIQSIGSGDEIADLLSQKLQHSGITFSIERFNPTERDLNILVGKIKNRAAEAVVAMAYPPALNILAREFNRQKIDKPIVLFASAGFMYGSNKNLFDGMYVADALQPSVSLRKHLGFNENENAPLVAFFYDTGTFITQAFEKAYDGVNIPTGDEVSDQLLSQKEYQGYQEVYTLDERGQFLSKVEIYIVKDGKLVPVMGD